MHSHVSRRAGILVALALGRATSSSAQEYETYCLPQSQLVLGGVELGADSQQVRAKLGPPSRDVQDSSEDDGGVYALRHIYYRTVQVDIGRNRVELISTSSPLVSLPAGVRVGMTIAQVGRILKLPGAAQYLKGDTLAPIACLEGSHSPDLAGLALIFGPPSSKRARRLVKILLTEYGP